MAVYFLNQGGINSFVVRAVESGFSNTLTSSFIALLKPISAKARTNSLVAEAGESRLSTTSFFFYHF